MTTLESLVTEWRDAREAILLVNWGDPVVAKAHVHLWTRLGHAEAALMAHARGIPSFMVFPSALERMEFRPDGNVYIKLPITHIDPAQPNSEQTIRWSFDGSRLTSWEPDPTAGSAPMTEPVAADPATPKNQGEGT